MQTRPFPRLKAEQSALCKNRSRGSVWVPRQNLSRTGSRPYPLGYRTADSRKVCLFLSVRVDIVISDMHPYGHNPYGYMEHPMATFLYARVSTAEQTLSHQQTQAEKAGFRFDHVIADHGVSGVSVLMKDRPDGKRLFDMLRAEDMLVVRWVDRLGRNYADVTDTIREFMRRGVVIRTIINNMTFDGSTTDPMQMAVRDAMISFMAASAQAQAEATKEAQKAGIANAKEKDDAYRGRKPSYSREQFQTVMDLVSKSRNVSEIAQASSLSRQTVYRIKEAPAAAEKALAVWGL